MWQQQLQDDADLWTVRRFGQQDLVWRNRKYLEHRQRFGVFPSDTVPWAGACQYVSPQELMWIESAYQYAFETTGWVELPNVTMQVPGFEPVELRGVALLAVAGDINNGLVVSHQFAAHLPAVPAGEF